MKTLLAMLLVAASAFAGDTNVIDLKHKPFAITNLQGTAQIGQLLTADLDGVLYLMPDGVWRNRISYTNLTLAMLEDWGIPTNRVQIARQRAEAKKQELRRYQQKMDEERREYAENAAIQQRLTDAEWDLRRAATGSKAKADAIAAQKQHIKQLEADRDNAWDSYIYMPVGAWSANNGVVTDSEGVRLSRARAADRQLRDEREKLLDMKTGN